MPKKKKTNKPKRSHLFILNTVLTILLVIALAFLTNLFLVNSELKEQQKLYQENLEKQLLAQQQEQYEIEQQAIQFEEKTKAMEIEYSDTPILDTKQPTINKEISVFNYPENEQTVPSPKKAIKKETKPKVKIAKDLPKQIKKQPTKQKPKLVIIIDDVTTSSQVRKITNIPYPITMAFLPPTKRHKHSARIAQNVDTYMIHLPLEASSRQYEEEGTLHIEDSTEHIKKKIKRLKELYPNTRYLNNHTGSKFTSNAQAMDKLLSVLKRYNYVFLDSRTTSKTVAKRYAKKHNVKYLSRNIFLDNKQDKRYIQKQLRKAVRIAKRDGSAIAIGHPHKITLKTLAQSQHLLNGVNVVLVDEI